MTESSFFLSKFKYLKLSYSRIRFNTDNNKVKTTKKSSSGKNRLIFEFLRKSSKFFDDPLIRSFWAYRRTKKLRISGLRL